jgi:hypothetical protein
MFVSLVMLTGCADRSKGAALSECRLIYYLESPTAQSEAIPACMMARSFRAEPACTAEADEDEWDPQVRTFAVDDPRCYRPLGYTAWIAIAMSPSKAATPTTAMANRLT